METKTPLPNFTLSLRGYDRMEVDDYLDRLAEALSGLDAAQAEADQMQAEIARLRSRVSELERAIRTETPRTGPALAERIALILQEAEQAAAETVRRADAEAEDIRRAARLAGAEADKQATAAVARAEEQARRIESEARSQAAEIVAEAEARAVVRTRQIEHWAEQVVSHTRAEEARMAAEKAAHRAGAEAEVAALVAKREAVAASLAKLRETLGEALGLIEPSDSMTKAPAAPPVSPLEARAGDDEADADQVTGPVIVIDASDDFDLEPEAGGADKPAQAAEPARPQADGEGTDATGALPAEPGLDDYDEERPWPAAFHPVGLNELDAKYDAWEAADADGPDSGGRHFKHLF